MRRALALLRLAAASAALAAVLAAPVVRAFAQALPPPGRCAVAALDEGGSAGSRHAHRAPGPQRSRRIHVSVLPPRDPSVARPNSVRFAFVHARLAHVPSFASPLDHPPA